MAHENLESMEKQNGQWFTRLTFEKLECANMLKGCSGNLDKKEVRAANIVVNHCMSPTNHERSSFRFLQSRNSNPRVKNYQKTCNEVLEINGFEIVAKQGPADALKPGTRFVQVR